MITTTITYVKDRIQGKTTKGIKRDPNWRLYRKLHLKRNNQCEICWEKMTLEVHHILPFHLFPFKELDWDNLVTLCRRCHLFVGHLDDYKKYNPNCREDIEDWHKKLYWEDN